jgi:hypothetical protein
MKGNDRKEAATKQQREPSKASLREMPGTDFLKVQVRPNPYAKRISAEGVTFQIGRGRPRKIFEVGGTVPQSVRFSPTMVAMLEKRTKEKG